MQTTDQTTEGVGHESQRDSQQRLAMPREPEPSANSTRDPVRSGVGGVSSILRETIETKLAYLRADCALKREIKRNAFGRRWARSARSNAENERDCGPSDKYWDDLQAEAQRKSTAELEAADKALADLIAEARPVMGPEWLGNDHGRLCWAGYLGGYPIKHHYCIREEGHEGHHADEWPHTRWACEDEAGSWPQGATCNREWNELAEAERARRAAAAEGVPEKACEQSGPQGHSDGTEAEPPTKKL